MSQHNNVRIVEDPHAGEQELQHRNFNEFYEEIN